MWTVSNRTGLVALALMSMMIIAGNGRDAENCRERGAAKCGGHTENDSTLKVLESASKSARKEETIKTNADEVMVMGAPRALGSFEPTAIDGALWESSVLYGVLSEIVHSPLGAQNRSVECRRNSELLFNGITNRELWALKGTYNARKSCE